MAPDPPRSAELAAERERLRHAEGLREAAAGRARRRCAGADEDGGGAAARAGRRPRRCCRASPASTPSSTRSPSGSAALAVELGDVGARAARLRSSGIEADPERLAAVEERLEAIDRLQRKHGGSVESVLAHAERCRAEIERLEGAEERGAEVEAALAEAEARRGGARRASSARAAPTPPRRCEERVAAELERLAMAGRDARGRARAAPRRLRAERRARRSSCGSRRTPGSRPAPLRDAASGGELSRVMLALSGLGAGAGAGDAGLRRDRRRGRRQHRPRRRRAAAGARRGPPGPLHHPPAAGRLARRRPTSGSRRTSTASAAGATVERLDGEGVVEEIRRMLGGERADEAADAPRPRAARRRLSRSAARLHTRG